LLKELLKPYTIQAVAFFRRQQEEVEGAVPKHRRLGRTRYADQALVVPEAPTGDKGLRSMPLKGSAIQERISSIVRRGLLPAPPEATRSEAVRRKKAGNKLKNSRKFMSPLLRDNLLLR